MSDRLRRAHLPDVPAPGERARLGPDESHHITRVLRLKPGDGLALFDGQGGEWEATLETIGRDGAWVVVGPPCAGTVEPPLPVVLVQSVVRPDKLDWVLQKGTEIGVAAFRLVGSARAEAPAPGPARLERYRRIVLEAVKQCGRRKIPSVEVGTLEDALGEARGWLLDPSPGARPIRGLLAAPPPPAVWIAVGPEGGFAPDEISRLEGRGWTRASLGPRVLRTETAGPVAAALALHAWGDLGAS